jgi:polysaccharide pyruvyl transferase WcaK-like protein
MAGFPAIHLSYERKGWGAFQDMGLDRYVLSARHAGTGDVYELIKEIQTDEASYWSRLEHAKPSILSQRARMMDIIASIGSNAR